MSQTNLAVPKWRNNAEHYRVDPEYRARVKEEARQRYAANKEKFRLKNKAAYEANKEQRKAAAKEYRQKHSEERAATNKRWRENLSPERREALRQYARDWRKANPSKPRTPEQIEKARAYAREKYATDTEHKEKVRKYRKEYRAKNPEKVKNSYKKWAKANPDRIRGYIEKWLDKDNNRARMKEYTKQYKIENRDKVEANRAQYWARRNGAVGEITNTHITHLHRWQHDQCYYCHEPLDGHATVEHIVPLSRGGTNHPYNVVLACNRCNGTKSFHVYPSEWMPKTASSYESLYAPWATKLAVKTLTEQGYNIEASPSGFQLGSLQVDVLSSFALSDDPRFIPAIGSKERIQTFDYEWRDSSLSLANVLAVKAGLAPSIGARELDFCEVQIGDVRQFMNTWHLQGFMPGSRYYVLHKEGILYAAASITEYTDRYELTRVCFMGHVAGGLSRLVSHFPKDKPLLSYCDLRFGEGDAYASAGGFTVSGQTRSAYCYANGVGLHHRLRYSKSAMAGKVDYFDVDKTEKELALINGLRKLNLTSQRRFILDVSA